MMDKAFLAKEAERLSKDPTLIEAVRKIRARAIEALVKADADKATEIARLQAKTVVCDEFMAELMRMIDAAAVNTRPTIV